MYKGEKQLNGSNVHESIDTSCYSTSKNVLQSLDIYCEQYNIIGKIDVFDKDKGELIERKKRIIRIYDGYIFQVYAQYYALTEMGYKVNSISLYSYDDNKKYPIPLPKDDKKMNEKFIKVIDDINNFDMSKFIQSNINKCMQCIYSDYCNISLV